MENAANRKIGLAALVTVIFAIVAGGPYGIEESVPSVGPGLILLLIVAVPLVWSLPIAFITAEISSAFPQKGGYITWIRNSYGPFWSFQTGWLSFIRNIVETALYPVLFVEYLRYFVPGITDAQRILICVAIVGAFTLLNLLGIRTVGLSAFVITVIVLVPFAILVVMALLKAKTLMPFSTFALPGKPWFNCLGIGMLIMIWNYNGWEDFSTCIVEVKNPAKNFPRALFINLPLIMLIYGATIYASLCATTNWREWTSGQFPLIGREIGGPWLGSLIVVAILFGLANQISTILLYTSRIPSALAHHRFLPRFFSWVIRRNRVPWLSLLFCSALVCIFCTFSFAGLITIDILLYGFLLVFEIMTFLKLRRTHPDKERLIRVPGNMAWAVVVALLPFSLLAIALYNNSFTNLEVFAATFLSGLAIWVLYSGRNIIQPVSRTVECLAAETALKAS